MRKSMKHLSCCLLPGHMSGFKSLWEDVCLELSSPSSEELSGGISGSKLLLAHAADRKGGFLLLELHEPRGFCRRMLRRACTSTGHHSGSWAPLCPPEMPAPLSECPCCAALSSSWPLAKAKSHSFASLVLGEVLVKCVHCWFTAPARASAKEGT